MAEAAHPSRQQGKAQGATLINNSQRPLNSEGLFRAHAPRNDLFIVRTYCALSTERVVLCSYQQKPAVRGPDSLWPLSASPPVAARRRHRQREVSGFTIPTGGEDRRRPVGAPLALPDLQVPGCRGQPPRSEEEGAGSAGAGVPEWGVRAA